MRPSAVDTVGAPSGDALLDQALLGGTARDWVALLKPRVMSLVVFSGAAGLLVAPVPLNPILAVAVIISIASGSGASGAINMWYDRDIDLVMRRTARRPIPSGRISPEGALTFGVGLALLSVLMMWFASNLLAASILALSILFYVFIYTIWLKRRTPQNIVIGGAAGAFPPIIGWAAATGSISALPLLMFALIFFWTPPHFWSLALFASEDYQRAGVPMMPVAKGARRTRWEILVYTAMLLPISVAPWYLGLAGPLYLVAALGLSLAFLWYAVAVLRDKQDSFGVSLTRDAPAKAAFKYSLIYLFALLGAMVIDHWIG
ncbi:MAG: heme o synthase [Acidiphilium sp.]